MSQNQTFKLTLEEIIELMKDPDNKCLKYGKCRDILCLGYSSPIICSQYHSINTEKEKRKFYKKYQL